MARKGAIGSLGRTHCSKHSMLWYPSSRAAGPVEWHGRCAAALIVNQQVPLAALSERMGLRGEGGELASIALRWATGPGVREREGGRFPVGIFLRKQIGGASWWNRGLESSAFFVRKKNHTGLGRYLMVVV